MADKIKIAELAIDDKALLNSLQATKQAIQDLSDQQKVMKVTGDENSKTFIENEAHIKSLRGEYNRQIKVLQATTTNNVKLTAQLGKEIKSIDQAVANNKELRQIRNQLNASTEEGAKKIKAINDKIDDNTDFIKDNTSALEQQKMGIGAYKDAIIEALGQMNPFSAGFEGIGAGAKGAATAIGKATAASVRFIATPIGAVLAVIGSAFLLVRNAINRSEESSDRLSKATSFLSGLFQNLLRVLEPVGDFLLDGIVKGLELVETGMIKTMQVIERGLRVIGLDDLADKYAGFAQSSQDAIAAAKEIDRLEKIARKNDRERNRLQLEYQKQQEVLRQQRDDESLTLSERAEANKKLQESLSEQLRIETELAQAGIKLAEKRIELEGDTTENLDFLAEKKEALADIEERINGQLSEQLMNENSLARDRRANAAEATKQAEDDDKKQQEAEQKELDRVRSFEDKKRQLEEEIEIRRVEDEYAREELKLQRELERHLREVDRMDANENEKQALRILYEKDTQDKLDRLSDKKEKEDKKRQDEAGKADKEAQQMKVQTRGEVAEAAIAMLGEETVAAKGASAAQSIYNTYQGATKALATKGFWGIAQAALIIASGLKSVGKITGLSTSTPTSPAASAAKNMKFASGGILIGASHANGGIKTPYGELEGGEAVINKRSTALFRPILSQLNEAGGGRKFASGGILGGGSVPDGILSSETIKRAVAEGFALAPPPRVGVDEITHVANRVQVIEDLSTF